MFISFFISLSSDPENSLLANQFLFINQGEFSFDKPQSDSDDFFSLKSFNFVVGSNEKPLSEDYMCIKFE